MVELNALVGLSSGHLSKIEHGDIVLTSQTAEKIADALDIGVEWLLKGDEEKKDYPISEKLIVWLWKNPELRKERKGKRGLPNNTKRERITMKNTETTTCNVEENIKIELSGEDAF